MGSPTAGVPSLRTFQPFNFSAGRCLAFAKHCGIIEGENDTETTMAKQRKIHELTTGVHDFPTLIGDKENNYDPKMRGIDDILVEKA